MSDLCKKAGHNWVVTTAPGWFACNRANTVEIRNRRAALGYGTRQVVCPAVAHCPGCLGHCIDGVTVQFCILHYQTCRLEDFAVVFPDQHAQRFTAPSADQQSLF